ncbi:MAG: hypothetical protein IK008_07405 [Bacteroidales bacterium]|nr:hypothetical protein [Bacteroidales bacterium]
MKKVLIALAAVMMFAACSSSPVDKIFKLSDEYEAIEAKIEKLDKEKDADQIKSLEADKQKLKDEAKAIREKNKDYELTDADRKAVINYEVKKYKESHDGKEPSAEEMKMAEEMVKGWKKIEDIKL